MYAMVRKMPSRLFYPSPILTGLFGVAGRLVALYNFFKHGDVFSEFSGHSLFLCFLTIPNPPKDLYIQKYSD